MEEIINKDLEYEPVVSFITAKLAKEKGFNLIVKFFKHSYYNHKGILNGDVTDLIKAQAKLYTLKKNLAPENLLISKDEEICSLETVPAPSMFFYNHG